MPIAILSPPYYNTIKKTLRNLNFYQKIIKSEVLFMSAGGIFLIVIAVILVIGVVSSRKKK